MNDFGAITILSEQCQSCPKVTTCDHKRMEHLGYIVPTRGNGKLDFQKQFYEAMQRRLNYENR